jgi:hypothetical protein
MDTDCYRGVSDLELTSFGLTREDDTLSNYLEDIPMTRCGSKAVPRNSLPWEQQLHQACARTYPNPVREY